MAVAEAPRARRETAAPGKFDAGGGATIEAPPEVWQEIQRLARETGATPEQVFSRALGLFAAAVEAAQRGQKVGFAASADVLTREVVGIIPER